MIPFRNECPSLNGLCALFPLRQGKIEKDFYGNVLSPWKPLLRKPLMAGEAEVVLNPRARSVRLRVAERTNLP